MSATALGICLVLAAGPGTAPRFVPTRAFTLAWTHSIEKTRWEEDYRVETAGPEAPPVLIAGKARIKGSGAGMDPPAGAVRKGSWYEYQPALRPAVPLRLTRSHWTADYDWCMEGRCLPLSAVMPNDGDITLLYPCAGPQPPPPDHQ